MSALLSVSRWPGAVREALGLWALGFLGIVVAFALFGNSTVPKLVATDMDGTLVRSDGTVSDRSHQVLARLRANGVTLVGATGRGPRLIELTRRDLGPSDYLVLAQGGHIYATGGPEPVLLHAMTVSGTSIARVVGLVEAAAGPVQLAVEAGAAVDSPLWTDPGFAWPYPEPTETRPRAEALRGLHVKAQPTAAVARAAAILMADEARDGQLIHVAEGRYKEIDEAVLLPAYAALVPRGINEDTVYVEMLRLR